ncbi:hypothetical protein J009_06706 [Cryptococcus neoformans]|nr:hypothetical protein J009_06706 [Cryptococcus neoformans var. grubii]
MSQPSLAANFGSTKVMDTPMSVTDLEKKQKRRQDTHQTTEDRIERALP